LYFIGKSVVAAHIAVGYAVGVPLLVLGLGLTVVAAHLMNVWVEKPILGLRFQLNDRPGTTKVLAAIQMLVPPAGIAYWFLSNP
jgi:hypothetical protein